MSAINEHYYAYAVALYEAGKFEDAEEAFSILCSRDKEEPRFRFGLAVCNQELKRYQKAIAEWDLAIQTANITDFPRTGMYYHKAECHLSLGQRTEAIKELNNELNNNPIDSNTAQKIHLLIVRNIRGSQEDLPESFIFNDQPRNE